MHKFVLIMSVILVMAIVTNGETAVILTQQASPLKIIKYEVKFEEEYRGTYGSHPDQITHSVTCQNTSGKVVVAYQIGLVAFDAFNNLMDKFSGWSIKNIPINGNLSGAWAQRPYATFSFEKYGTGVAYVNATRFEDGTIWRADLSEVVVELQKFEKDLKKEDLQENKKP